jgi:hypothetical protein
MHLHIKVNGGVWITIGSVLPAGILIQTAYDGEAPSIIMAYVLTLVCVGLEFTENLKPRINEEFPFFGIVFPAGLVLAHMDGGWNGLLNYAAIAILSFFGFRHLFRKSAKPTDNT